MRARPPDMMDNSADTRLPAALNTLNGLPERPCQSAQREHAERSPACRTRSTRPASSTGSTDTGGSSSSSCPTAARSRATCADIPTRATVPAMWCCRTPATRRGPTRS